MSPRPYGGAAVAYLEAGYSPLPLPPRRKAPPPEGYTGRDGREVAAAEVDHWKSENASSNLGVRLPRGVAGIDVDAYKDEFHVAAWKELVARCGPLPDAPWCSSRADGVSGVRLFRVPEDWEAAGKLPEASNGVSPGEVIQWHHRYVVCPPSIHPDTGRAYRWQSGGAITKATDLPALPRPWLDALSITAAPAEPDLPRATAPRAARQGDVRPGDDFNDRADWLTDILSPHGWTLHHESNGTLYVTRPGKTVRDGHSATIGHSNDGVDRLYVFSADAAPFETEKPYTKFAAYAVLNHAGDYQAAARELGRAGYGTPLAVQAPAASRVSRFSGAEEGSAGRRPAPDVIAALAARHHHDPAKVAAVLIGEYGLSAKVAQAAARTACGRQPLDEDEQQPEPPEPLPEIPRFPVQALAGPLRAFVDWGSRDGLHAECTAAAGLAALVTVAGPGRLKLGATSVKPILWIPLIGIASAGKSPAYAHAFAEIREAYARQREKYEADLADWREIAEADGKKAAGPMPARPEPCELDDATTEAVARWLNARGGDTSGSVVDDELAAFLEAMNQYKGGQGSDVSKWLKMWTGAPLHIQRVGAGGMVNGVDLYIPDPVVSVTGPLVTSNLHLLGRPGSGFRPRWLPFYAPPVSPQWNRAGDHPAAWTGCIDWLLENRKPREWTIDDAALAEWEKARRRWHDQQSDPEPDDVIEALRKADQQSLRIALVIAESLNPGNGGPVPVDAVKCAVAIMDYCINVWRALPGNSTMITSRREEVMDGAYRRLLAWLETRPAGAEGLPDGAKPRSRASRREVQQWLHESPQKINELIAEHRMRWPGCVVETAPPGGGRKTILLYSPPRGRISSRSADDVAATSSPADDNLSGYPERPGHGAGIEIGSDVAGDVAPTPQHRSATSLRTVACPSCGTAARSAVEPGERAYCKHCDTEYIAA